MGQHPPPDLWHSRRHHHFPLHCDFPRLTHQVYRRAALDSLPHQRQPAIPLDKLCPLRGPTSGYDLGCCHTVV